jgi:5'-3' exonuclease
MSPAAPSAEHQERRLFLIDGPSLVYRAFFALPESIATSTGVPTNAIFGFASMLVKIITEYGVGSTTNEYQGRKVANTATVAPIAAHTRDAIFSSSVIVASVR